MEYREHQPVARLAPFLECLWTLEGHTGELAGETQPVLPDGRTELVVHFGEPFERIEEGIAELQPAVIFAGQLTRRLVLRPTGRISVLGVRFRPYGAAPFVREPQGRLVGLTLDASEVSGPLSRVAAHVRESARSLDAAVASMQQQLVGTLPTVAIDSRVASAVAAIDHSTVSSASTSCRYQSRRRGGISNGCFSSRSAFPRSGLRASRASSEP